MQIAGTAAIVTGAASGLGAATARMLAEAGATVYGLDLPDAVAKAGQVPDGVTLIPADVTNEVDVQAAIDRAATGSRPIRIGVNCAGVAWASRILGKKGPHPLDLFQRVMDINVVGSFNVLRLVAESMQGQEPVDEHGQRGVIINTASAAAFEGQIGQVAYAASKGAIHAMGIASARDLAQHGIRVNTIAPGTMETPMLAGLSLEFRAALQENVPFPSRLGQPEEYAKLAVTIIEHDYLNGETIRMDGALRMASR